MRILVTGGAGYIGSHTVLELLRQGYEVSVIDNLSNSSSESIKKIEKLTNKKISFHEFDLCNHKNLEKCFAEEKYGAVIHFAGLKAVGESVEKALYYYRNNLVSTLTLLEVMEKNNIKNLVFSSSATIYGDPKSVPIPENAVKQATNPYGQTKLMIEQILEDIVRTKSGWQATSLRYFNPVGADPSGEIGEDPNGLPNNLLPFVSQVAVGKLAELKIFGNDYPTRDGTGVRDYIHVSDLAEAHVAAIKKPAIKNKYRAINIGTGKGTSVLEIVRAFELASGKKIKYKIAERRAGDIAECYAGTRKAKKELKWQATRSINDACADAWNWQSKNPNGYSKIVEHA